MASIEAMLEWSKRCERAERRVAELEAAIREHSMLDDQVGSFESSCIDGGMTFDPADALRIEEANERLWSVLDGEKSSRESAQTPTGEVA